MLWNRKILILILSAGFVEPRPRAAQLQEELLPHAHAHVPVPFNFGYEVSNADTGDTKTHQETLEDGVLRGSYSVVQPDGFRRVVNYVSDAEHGFRADVTFEKGYENVIPSFTQQQASIISTESTGSTSSSQVSSSNSLSAKADSSSSVNLDITESLSKGSSASTQEFISTGFSSPLVQVSDINNYGNAQFESIDSSHSTSGESSITDVTLTNTVAESSLDTGLSLDTTNINSANEASINTFDPPRHQSLEHYYTNSQIFCASCNTGTFGTSSFGSNFESSNSGSSSSGSSGSVASISESSSSGLSNSESTSFVSSSSGSSSLGSENVISTNNNAELSFAGNSENTVAGTGGVTDFGDIFSRSFLVASENLDNINTVELAKAGFDTDHLYAYKLVRVPIVEEVTRE